MTTAKIPSKALRKSFALSKVYGLLEAGPVVLLTTSRNGRANIMTQSWHSMLEFAPPLIACVVSDRNYSFAALKATRQCVINIPAADIAAKVVACGNSSGAKLDKFKKFGLTALPAQQVAAPLIAECFANLECRVVDTGMVKKYDLFVVEVVKAWIDPAAKNPRTLHHLGHGRFMVAGDKIKLKSKMK